MTAPTGRPSDMRNLFPAAPPRPRLDCICVRGVERERARRKTERGELRSRWQELRASIGRQKTGSCRRSLAAFAAISMACCRERIETDRNSRKQTRDRESRPGRSKQQQQHRARRRRRPAAARGNFVEVASPRSCCNALFQHGFRPDRFESCQTRALEGTPARGEAKTAGELGNRREQEELDRKSSSTPSSSSPRRAASQCAHGPALRARACALFKRACLSSGSTSMPTYRHGCFCFLFFLELPRESEEESFDREGQSSEERKKKLAKSLFLSFLSRQEQLA